MYFYFQQTTKTLKEEESMEMFKRNLRYFLINEAYYKIEEFMAE